ncbi:hypothetical protein DFH11DRAFT_1075604 [Phellopilus nigrolimitatus]|nr:hypothetical protein DFH11DRAFT_1075604 [Phellopilus nigrolimitatus]
MERSSRIQGVCPLICLEANLDAAAILVAPNINDKMLCPFQDDFFANPQNLRYAICCSSSRNIDIRSSRSVPRAFWKTSTQFENEPVRFCVLKAAMRSCLANLMYLRGQRSFSSNRLCSVGPVFRNRVSTRLSCTTRPRERRVFLPHDQICSFHLDRFANFIMDF